MSGAQMHLNLNLRVIGSHRAAWRHATSRTSEVEEAGYLIELARAAERERFDAVFLGDRPVLSEWGNGTWPFAFPPEPFGILAAIAARTEHIGLIGTASSTYSDLEALANTTAMLDHLSGGRLGVNFVTSTGAAVARNFGHDEHPDHARRYDRAAEFIAGVTGLWDGAAAAEGRARRPFRHHGEFFDIDAKLAVPPSPQGRPLIVQAGTSDQGRDFAARHAEMIYTGSTTIEAGRAFVQDIRARAAQAGRPADALRVLPGVVTCVGGTEAEARALAAELEALAEEREDPLAILGRLLGIDLSGCDPQAPLPQHLLALFDRPGAVTSSAQARAVAWAREGRLGLRDLAREARRRLGNVQFNLTGSGEQVADALEQWFRAGAADGFNILPALYPLGAEAFFSEVMPVLRRRGLIRSDYAAPTLRGNLGLAPLAGAVPA